MSAEHAHNADYAAHTATAINATHDASLQCWVESAHDAGSDFPVQNLPFASFSKLAEPQTAPRCGVGIGHWILDISAIEELFEGEAQAAAHACRQPQLNALMAFPSSQLSLLRQQLSQLLCSQDAAVQARIRPALVAQADVQLHLPFKVSGYTDFFASIHHATNAGQLFRPDQPLLPNYKYVPIAYNGRANSVQVSGDKVTRPKGQLRPAAELAAPAFAPSARLDHEVELGIVIGQASTRGQPIAPGAAWQHVFGFCLLNDWSARDIQAWEYQPLGPFLAKSFATSIAPWVITAEALAPFHCPAAPRSAGDPAVLPHLLDDQDMASGGIAITLDAALSTARMRAEGIAAHTLSRSNARSLYWTVAQMLAHHTCNGSALDTADLLGSGTISGEGDSALGSLLEITRGGSQRFTLPSGEERSFLQDGDEIILRGHCERAGFVRIGFGECRATILAAQP
ncbi:fumarylacetoacetase [Lampropedia puyangensis]|uniref:fumarylacetoacetase n=1 Tax=Lampropedia puyangensis TaxID=1330072 RepID=A0A4S8EWZ2_9BURK|nr:fumarylacetoacetase [Lampropedia puyangensis]THT99332.1 fumarylacetoacetase [Lampropedia puyangensis]